MIQAIVCQNTNYLIPNKEHKNFTDSSDEARVGSVITGEFRNVDGLRKGKPFQYRLFFTKNGKILYANCVKAENVPSEILQGADQSVTATKVNLTPVESFRYAAHIVAFGGGLLGYFYGKKQNKTGMDLAKYTAVGAVGAYGIYWLIDQNKSTIINPSK
jgi:hypothetical protein